MTNPPPFAALFVQRPGGRVYARDYAGDGPAFVLCTAFRTTFTSTTI
jgi:hypothetical protein